MRRTTALAAVALLAFGLSQLRAQEPQGPREGIKVHGHWAIDVKTPDGSLVSHTEFENALTMSGAGVLSSLLTRGVIMGDWLVSLNGPANPCIIGTATSCRIWETNANIAWDGATVATLTSKQIAVGSSSGIALTGTIQAPVDGTIADVSTLIAACSSSTTVANCLATSPGTPNHFTDAILPTPAVVVANQIIQVTVTISFS